MRSPVGTDRWRYTRGKCQTMRLTRLGLQCSSRIMLNFIVYKPRGSFFDGSLAKQTRSTLVVLSLFRVTTIEMLVSSSCRYLADNHLTRADRTGTFRLSSSFSFSWLHVLRRLRPRIPRSGNSASSTRHMRARGATVQDRAPHMHIGARMTR